MRYLTLFTFILSSLLSIDSTAQAKFDGLWGGALDVNGLKVEVNFEVQTEAKRVLLSVPLQNISDQVGSGLEINGDTLFFDYSNFGASYSGVYDESSKQIVGEWTQGLSIELNLKRQGKKTKIERSQKVKPPFPYTYENIKFPNKEANIELAGTVTIPEGEGPFPLAILISGSGPQNRNSEILDHAPFLVIADHLSRNGIAVLRYDDRGVSASGGDYQSSTSADFATDAWAAIQYAETLDRIDVDKVGLIGHSEGGLIAPKVAVDYKNVDFIVSIAGPGVPIAELMTMQNKLMIGKMGMSEKGITVLEEHLPRIYEIVNQDKTQKELFDTLSKEIKTYYNALPENDRPLLGESSQVYFSVLNKTFFQPWFRYFLAYDPEPVWQQVQCPVLALNGSEDIQVSSKQNLEAIQRHLEIAGNKNFQVVEVEGLNHLMQECEVCNVPEYRLIETTFEPKVLDMITAFLKGL